MPQSLARYYIHLIFSTKHRMDLLPHTFLTEMHAYLAGILQPCDCQAVSIGGTTNHVHLLFALSKNKTLAEVIRTLKANSSRWINQHGYANGHFAWQDGYGAFSISQSHVDAVHNYIRHQEEHHREVTFQDELRRLCRLYGMEIDERYVWE